MAEVPNYWESDIDDSGKVEGESYVYIAMRQVTDHETVLDPVIDVVDSDICEVIKKVSTDFETHKSVYLLFRATWYVYRIGSSSSKLVKQFIVYPSDAELVDFEDPENWVNVINRDRKAKEIRSAFKLME